MFDIGFPELVLIAIVGLLVIGPERLPEALRTLGLWIGRMRRSFTSVKAEIEKEIGMDEIRRQLHNEAVMEELKRIERDVRHSVDQGAADPAGPKAAENQIAPPAEAGADDQDAAHQKAGERHG
ncbi:MAG: Sec-independent protein translocase protein TatB [Pseudomonadales bacterium]